MTLLQPQNPSPLSLNSYWWSIQEANCHETVGHSQYKGFSNQINSCMALGQTLRSHHCSWRLPPSHLHHQCHHCTCHHKASLSDIHRKALQSWRGTPSGLRGPFILSFMFWSWWLSLFLMLSAYSFPLLSLHFQSQLNMFQKKKLCALYILASLTVVGWYHEFRSEYYWIHENRLLTMRWSLEQTAGRKKFYKKLQRNLGKEKRKVKGRLL